MEKKTRSSARTQRRLSEKARKKIMNSNSRKNHDRRIGSDITTLRNPSEVIEIRVYKLNGIIASGNISYHLDFEYFKGAIYEEFKQPSTNEEMQEYIKAIKYSLEDTIDEYTAAIGTFSFLACCDNVKEATLKRFSEIRSFAIIILFSDEQFQVLCMSKSELANLDNGNYKGIKII